MGGVATAADWPLGAPFVACVLLAMLYARGGRRGRSRSRSMWRAAAFYSGIATIMLALDTPIDAFADRLFWVHMTQHVLLLTVAPPLLVLGRAWPRLWRPLPRKAQLIGARAFRVASPLARPPVALVLIAVDVGVWHLPALYNATLSNNLFHQLEHLSFVLVGILFWAALLGAPPLRTRVDGLKRTVYFVLALAPSWILAIVLAYARSPLYAYGTLRHRPGGISALADQQLAAGVMWVPGSIAYVVAAAWSFYLWLDSESPRRPLGIAGQH
jgi:putative membrane protein